MKHQILKTYSRSCIRLLRGYQTDSSQPFINQKAAYGKAVEIVQYFYILIFLWTVNIFFFTWEEWSQLSSLPQPLWPVKWLNQVPFLMGLNTLGVAAIVITLLVAIYPRSRVLRILSFVAFLQVMAIPNSFGKINHDMHLWVTAGFFLIFLPNTIKKSITSKHHYLTVFFGVQVLILTFYTSSGVWKLAGAAIQFWAGEIHAFHPLALSQHIANRLLQTNFDSIFGAYLIEHPYLGWPLFSGAIFLELFSVIIAFRPNLHRFWGMSLIMLHLGIWFTLHIPFLPNIVFMMMFFVHSPFHPKDLLGKEILFSLPFLGEALIYRSKRKVAPILDLPLAGQPTDF